MIDYLKLCSAFENYKQSADKLNKYFSELESFINEQEIKVPFTYSLKDCDPLFQIIWDKHPTKKEHGIFFYFEHPEDREIGKRIWIESPLKIRMIAGHHLQEFINKYAEFLKDLTVNFDNY